MTVSLKTLEVISWNSGISWRRLTKSRCPLERGIELFDCLSSPPVRLTLRGLDELCRIACCCREIDGDGCCGVAGGGDDWCGVSVRCEVGVCRGVDGWRCRWVPV